MFYKIKAHRGLLIASLILAQALMYIYIPSHSSSMLYAETKSENTDLSSLSLAGLYVLPVEDRVPALNFQLENLETKEAVKLSQFSNQVLVMNYWATWCLPCRAEMPAIEALHQELKDEGLNWLAINSGEDRATVADYIDKYKYSFPVLLDPKNDSLYQYGIQSLPASIIVNKHGYIVALAIGSIDWRKPEIVGAFRKLLAED